MFKHIYPTLFSCFFLSISWGQSFSENPYSALGIGESDALTEARFGGVGSANASVYDSVTINTFNPASYAFLSKGMPLFGVSLASNLSEYTQNGVTGNGRIVGITNFSLVIPFKKKFGLAFGLKPYTRKGYTFKTYELFEGDSVEYSYLGSGSTQNAFVGLSHALIKNKKNELSLGFNFGYVFGKIQTERRSKFIGTTLEGAADINEINLGAFNLSFGALYTRNFCFPKNQIVNDKSDLALNHRITLGFTIEPEHLLAAKKTYGLYYSNTDIDDLSSYDTISYEENISGQILTPQKFSLGLSYTFRPLASNRTGKTIYALTFHGNYTSISSSRYKETFNEVVTSENVFIDASTLNFGIEYLPKAKNDVKAMKYDYVKRIQYRIGYTNQNFSYNYNSIQYKQNSITMGLALPLGNVNSNTRINLSAQYGLRSAGAGSMEHKIWNFGVGIVVAPSLYDSWFRKYKLD